MPYSENVLATLLFASPFLVLSFIWLAVTPFLPKEPEPRPVPVRVTRRGER